MADISSIKLPSGNTYDIKDSTARSAIPTKISQLTNDSGFITGMTILSYGSSTWADFEAAYNANKVVYCRASSNANPASGSQTRLAFMAYVNNATTPTNVEFQYYRSVSSHTASQQGDQVFVYKLDKTSGWSVTTREASVKVVAGDGLGGTYSNGTMTLTGPTKVSDLTNDSGFITTETDPTVPSWAKESSKPTYTASEVGALPDTTVIPSKTSDLVNDSGFIDSYTETDPVFTASDAYGISSSDISNWNGKQNAITGGASTITSSDLTASRALVSDSSGKVAVSAVTSTELGYLDGVTSAVQTQLNARATLTSGKVTADQASSDLVSITANTTLALTHAGKFLLVNSTSARTITIPTNASVAFPIETEIEICRWNTGTVTISPASGVTLVSTETARKISARYGVVAMKKISENTWLLTGALG